MSEFNFKSVCQRVKFRELNLEPETAGDSADLIIRNRTHRVVHRVDASGNYSVKKIHNGTGLATELSVDGLVARVQALEALVASLTLQLAKVNGFCRMLDESIEIDGYAGFK